MTRSPYSLQWVLFPLRIAPLHGDLHSHLMRGSLDSPGPTTPMASQSVKPFLQGLRLWSRQTDRHTMLLHL